MGKEKLARKGKRLHSSDQAQLDDEDDDDTLGIKEIHPANSQHR